MKKKIKSKIIKILMLKIKNQTAFERLSKIWMQPHLRSKIIKFVTIIYPHIQMQHILGIILIRSIMRICHNQEEMHSQRLFNKNSFPFFLQSERRWIKILKIIRRRQQVLLLPSSRFWVVGSWQTTFYHNFISLRETPW